jgi:hypothetical protein
MAIKPKQILDTAVDVGKSAVGAAERRIRGRRSVGPSGAPSTVGAAKPGTAGGPKSSTAPKRKPKARAKAKAKPAKKRATASRAAATSGTQVKRAAKDA